MWLTRITLNPRSREVLADLANVQALHRRVMSAFPEADGSSARATYGVLHRLDTTRTGSLQLLVQSRTEPGPWSDVLPSDYALPSLGVDAVSVRDASAVLDAITEGAAFDFRLRCNPTKRLARDNEGSRLGKGARVGLRKPIEQAEWLARKAQQHGFELAELPGGGNAVERDSSTDHGTRRGRERMTFEGVTFEGRLRVVDPKAFREAVMNGIGSGKAYGFGLLTLARPGALGL